MLKVLLCLLPILIGVKAEVFTLTHESQCHSIPMSITDMCYTSDFAFELDVPFNINVTCNSTNQKIWFGLSSKSIDDIFDSIEPYIVYSTQFYGGFVKTMDLAEIYGIRHEQYCIDKIYLISCIREFTNDISASVDYNYVLHREFRYEKPPMMILGIIICLLILYVILRCIYENYKKPNDLQPPQRLQEAETDSEPEEDTSLNRVSRVELMERHEV